MSRIARALLVSGAITVAAGGLAVAERREPRAKKHELVKAQGPLALHVTSVDLGRLEAVVRVEGVAREPDSRLFVLHDERGRHFVALDVRCVASTDGTALDCTLALPAHYLRRGRVMAATVHLRGREIEAPPDEVRRVFEAAAAALPDGGVGALVPRPDGGVRARLGSASRDGGAPREAGDGGADPESDAED